ncbi:MAG: NAD(P)-dependent alcohol dehydrogenase [Flavobacteriales bacterium]
MKAAINATYGAPDVVHVVDVPKPIAKADELLVRVHASTVNRTDIGFRKGKPYLVRLIGGVLGPKRTILGCEFAGEVEATGAEVRSFALGDRVFGFTGVLMGGHAEYTCVKASGAVAIQPPGVGHAQAAPILEGAHYALNDLRASRLQAGQHILINGATGAIGSAAVQLAKHFGATVTAVCNHQHVDLVRSLGADVVIDRHQQDFTTMGGPYDVIFDAVGKSSFGKCRPLLTSKGIYVSTELGHYWQNIPLTLITPLFGGRKVIFPIPRLTQTDAIFLRDLVAVGAYKPVIDRHYPLERIVEAHRYVDSGEKVGNVVVEVG